MKSMIIVEPNSKKPNTIANNSSNYVSLINLTNIITTRRRPSDNTGDSQNSYSYCRCVS